MVSDRALVVNAMIQSQLILMIRDYPKRQGLIDTYDMATKPFMVMSDRKRLEIQVIRNDVWEKLKSMYDEDVVGNVVVIIESLYYSFKDELDEIGKKNEYDTRMTRLFNKYPGGSGVKVSHEVVNDFKILLNKYMYDMEKK